MEQLLIKAREVELGYCNQCGDPKLVAEFILHGWKHHFRLCDKCIGEMSGIIRKATPAFEK